MTIHFFLEIHFNKTHMNLPLIFLYVCIVLAVVLFFSMRMRKVDRKSIKENITEYREEQNLDESSKIDDLPK